MTSDRRRFILVARQAQARVNLYALNFTLSMRQLRDVLTLESLEALELARAAGLETPCARQMT